MQEIHDYLMNLLELDDERHLVGSLSTLNLQLLISNPTPATQKSVAQRLPRQGPQDLRQGPRMGLRGSCLQWLPVQYSSGCLHIQARGSTGS